MLIYIANKTTQGIGANKTFPAFEGNIDPDIVILGFKNIDTNNSYLVFEEPMSVLRYGLDEITTGVLPDDDDNISWQHFELAEEQEGYLNGKGPSGSVGIKWKSPSYWAKIFTQKSVRVAMPLSDWNL